MSSGSLRGGGGLFGSARAGGGARGGREDGHYSHGREPHFAAPLGARAGVGQPVLLRQRGTACSSFNLELHGVVSGIARGREGRRKRLRRRFGLVFGRGISASHSGDVALLPQTSHIVDALTREQRGSRSVSDALSHRSFPSCALPGSAFAERTLTGQPRQSPQRRKTRGAGVRAASTTCPQRRKSQGLR